MVLPEFLKDPVMVHYIVSGINAIASIVVIIAAISIRRNRKHIQKTTKLLGESSINLETTFDSMLKAIIGIAELRKLYPRDGDIHVQTKKEKKKTAKRPPPKKLKEIDLNKTIELTDEVEPDLNKTIELTDEVINMTNEIKHRGVK